MGPAVRGRLLMTPVSHTIIATKKREDA